MGAKPTQSRRSFLKGLVTAAAASPAARRLVARPSASPPRERLSLFRYSDVQLTGGPLKAQFDRIHAYYLSVDEDRLLKAFRQRAGLNAPGEDMGGWYNPDGFAPGHCLGQIISGLSRFAEATGSAATQAKVRRLVEGFAATIGPDGFAYMNRKAANDFPAYMLDKNLIGLLDASRFAGVSSALEVVSRIMEGSIPYLPSRALEQDSHRAHSPYDESYTLPENFFYAYEVTGTSEYLDLAKKYLMDESYFDPLSRGINAMVGKHAYSHVNALSSAARAYQDLGDSKYLQVIQNAWDMLETTQEFASGGWGPNETFVEPNQGKLGASLNTTHAHFETPCGAYAHKKLARYLLRFTGEARYGDGLERVLYNTILGAKDPKGDDHFFYYSDYYPATRKGYHGDKWPCCAGTLPQVVADYIVGTYFQSPEGIFVNLFAPSEVRWQIHGMPAKLVQTTSYPDSDSTELRLELPAAAEFALCVRIPGWLRSSAEIAVNGRAQSVPAEPRTFATLRRRWQNHDTVQLRFPLSFRTERIDAQHPNTVAVMRGPLMLVAIGPTRELPKDLVTSPNGFQPAPGPPADGLSFDARVGREKIRFMPFYAVQEQTYTTYVTET